MAMDVALTKRVAAASPGRSQRRNELVARINVRNSCLAPSSTSVTNARLPGWGGAKTAMNLISTSPLTLPGQHGYPQSRGLIAYTRNVAAAREGNRGLAPTSRGMEHDADSPTDRPLSRGRISASAGIPESRAG